jgi:hypothetical protein
MTRIAVMRDDKHVQISEEILFKIVWFCHVERLYGRSLV